MDKKIIFFMILGLLLISSCAKQDSKTQMPNPASVFCEKNGGTLEIITAKDGSQSGLCTLKDGTKCDEWAYYKKECPKVDDTISNTGIANPASEYCEKNGGTLEIIIADDGSQSGECTLIGGTKCEEWAYYRGECKALEEIDCSGCPQFSPASENFCFGGTVMPGFVDDCGCRGPPVCDMANAGSEQRVMPLTEEICTNAKGHWNECGSACRDAALGDPCTMQCVQYCECGGIAGFGCPDGYECKDYVPKGAADAMGICAPLSNV